MAFCLYSGALFSGMLIPMTLGTDAGLLLPDTAGTPVIIFAFVIADSIEKLGTYFNAIFKVEKVMRVVAGLAFIITGLYYVNIYVKVI